MAPFSEPLVEEDVIIAETADRYRFVTQPAHADLAGQFADRWGTETFDQPNPAAPLAIAAYTHDIGWWEYDRYPRLADDGTPVDFREMPAGPWIDLYDDGIDTVVEIDDYAGLLVSMHGAGLRNQRYGLSPSWPETPPDFRDFVDREEERQARLAEQIRDRDGPVSDADEAVLASLHESGHAPEGQESRLWSNYRLLQAWDTLSLAFCITESPPGYGEIDPVPTQVGTADETLSIEALGNGEFLIEPYPFDESPLNVSVPTRTVSNDAFDDQGGLVQAYYEAEREMETFRLRWDRP